MTFGIFYVATGSKYLQEVIANVKLSKSFLADIPIAVSTDLVDTAINSSLFSTVINHPNPSYSYRDKIIGLQELPFSSTLFLDTDVKPSAHLADFSASFSPFSLAGCHAPVRIPPGWTDISVPPLFPEINTGVLFLKNSLLVNSILERWLVLYDRLLKDHNQLWDQASFRSVVWDYISSNTLSLFILPPEFNLRTTKAWIVGRGIKSYFVHGRFPDDEWLPFLSYLNDDIDRVRTCFEWSAHNSNSLIRPRYDNTFG